MKVVFIYPAFERHAQSHPELKHYVPCNEYIGPPSLGIASVAACTPDGIQVEFIDDRIHPVDDNLPEADLYALSFFTPAATRALMLGDMLRAAGKKVVAGGVFPTMMPEECAPHCDTLVIGEGEPVWATICEDARAGKLKPRYQSTAPANLDSLPPPAVDLYLNAEDEYWSPDDYPLQLSRGCPFTCQACVVPSVMGKKLRFFPAATVWKTLQTFSEKGKLCSLTEDTSLMFFSGARRRFRAFLNELIERRKSSSLGLSYIGTSMPLLLNLESEVMQEARDAGIHRFYLVCGFDPITRDAFGKGDAAAMVKAEDCISRCHDAGVEPYLSLLVGNDEDDESVFERILEFTHRTHIRIAEFAIATPYPGTPAWSRLSAEDRILNRTWRLYNDANVVFKPAQLSPEQLQEGYLYLWREFYRGKQTLANATRTERTVQF